MTNPDSHTLKHLAIVAVAALLAVAAVPAHAQLSNGGFETPVGVYTLVSAPGSLGAWNVTAGDVEVFNPTTYALGPAPEGNQIIDMLYTNTPGVMSQSIVTLPSQQYTLNFMLGNSTASNRSGTGSISIAVDIGLPTVFNTPIGLSASAITWAAYSLPFTATSALTSLSVAGGPLDGNFHFAFIDAMQVTAVPEAGTWSMLLAGLAVVGFMARRRSA